LIPTFFTGVSATFSATFGSGLGTVGFLGLGLEEDDSCLMADLLSGSSSVVFLLKSF
jgi:hypothetical protein